MKNMFVWAALALACSSCATIVRGTKDDFSVQTTPSGAKVTLSNGLECAATPCTFKLPRKEPFLVTVELAGYKTVIAEINSENTGSADGALAGNLLLGGVIGLGVDTNSGALNDLVPNPLILSLEPVAAGSIQMPAIEEGQTSGIETQSQV